MSNNARFCDCRPTRQIFELTAVFLSQVREREFGYNPNNKLGVFKSLR